MCENAKTTVHSTSPPLTLSLMLTLALIYIGPNHIRNRNPKSLT